MEQSKGVGVLEQELGKKKVGISPVGMIIILLILAFIIRALAGMSFAEYLDLKPWNIPWALRTQNGFFNAYSRIENLDYPPILPFFLYLSGKFMSLKIFASFEPMILLFVKLFPILADVTCVGLIFWMGKKASNLSVALFLAGLWALNPSMIFNVAYWGQSDSLLILTLLLTFAALENDRPILSAVFYALACLSKLQAAYYAVLYLLALIHRYSFKKGAMALGVGVGCGILGWLPFMIGSKELLLPFRIYLGGFGSYPYINLNACNVYGIRDNNWMPLEKSIFGGTEYMGNNLYFGGFTYGMLGNLILAAIFIGLVGIYAYAMVKKKPLCSYLMGMLFGNFIFMLTTQQHERYQIGVLVFCVLAFLRYQTWSYMILLLGISFVTFGNQAMLIFWYQYQGLFEEWFVPIQKGLSWINIGLLFFMVFTVVETVKKDWAQPKKEKIEQLG